MSTSADAELARLTGPPVPDEKSGRPAPGIRLRGLRGLRGESFPHEPLQPRPPRDMHMYPADRDLTRKRDLPAAPLTAGRSPITALTRHHGIPPPRGQGQPRRPPRHHHPPPAAGTPPARHASNPGHTENALYSETLTSWRCDPR